MRAHVLMAGHIGWNIRRGYVIARIAQFQARNEEYSLYRSVFWSILGRERLDVALNDEMERSISLEIRLASLIFYLCLISVVNKRYIH